MDEQEAIILLGLKLDELATFAPPSVFQTRESGFSGAVQKKGFHESLDMLFKDYPGGDRIIDTLKKYEQSRNRDYIFLKVVDNALSSSKEADQVAKAMDLEDAIPASQCFGTDGIDILFRLSSPEYRTTIHNIRTTLETYWNSGIYNSVSDTLNSLTSSISKEKIENVNNLLQALCSKKILDTIDAYKGYPFSKRIPMSLFTLVTRKRSVNRLEKVCEVLNEEDVLNVPKEYEKDQMAMDVYVVYAFCIENTGNPEALRLVAKTMYATEGLKERRQLVAEFNSVLLSSATDTYDIQELCERYRKPEE